MRVSQRAALCVARVPLRSVPSARRSALQRCNTPIRLQMQTFMTSANHNNNNNNNKTNQQSQNREKHDQEPFADPLAHSETNGETEITDENEIEQQQQEDPRDLKIQELERGLKECQEKLLLSYAERENIRKIAKDDVNRANLFGVQDFAKGVIEVADNLERALAATDKAVGLEPRKHHSEESIRAAFGDNHLARELYEGVRMTETEMLKFFSKNHISRRYPLGEKFNPDHMEALVAVPDPTKESGTVIFVQRAGYLLHHRVLRAAEVGVAK